MVVVVMVVVALVVLVVVMEEEDGSCCGDWGWRLEKGNVDYPCDIMSMYKYEEG